MSNNINSTPGLCNYGVIIMCISMFIGSEVTGIILVLEGLGVTRDRHHHSQAPASSRWGGVGSLWKPANEKSGL
jgi:hypothetical protein